MMNELDDAYSSIPPAPWWARRVRHGSLFGKRFKHWAAIAMLGFSWFVSWLYQLVLDSFVIELADKALSCIENYERLKEVLGYFWTLGTLLTFAATVWTLFWIYCDSLCTATEHAQARAGSSKRTVRSLTRSLFWTSVLWSVVGGLAVYLGARSISDYLGITEAAKHPTAVTVPNLIPGGRPIRMEPM